VRVLTVVLLAVVSGGCAARQPPRDVAADAGALVRAGCYRCLEDALALVDGRKDLPSRQRAFEVAVLLTARSKELGLPPEEWMARANAAAAALPPTSAAHAFLALAAALPPDSAALDSDQEFTVRRALSPPDEVRGWIAAIQASSASVEAQLYLTLAGSCAFFRLDRAAALAAASARAEGMPLLEYAIGSCTSDEEKWLLRALEHEPRFDDAAYALGRYLLNRYVVNRPDEDPSPYLAGARAAFPSSPAIAYVEATLFRARREWQRAADAYDATLRLVPTHHNARLGRTIALGQLARHEEAIAAATSLIDEGRWLVGDAYYWRAWNAFTLDRLDEAERDVEQAKQRMRSTSVFVLSGLVQWRKRRPTVAESEFVHGVELGFGDCDAPTYLGSVRVELRKWGEAADAFGVAEGCRQRETHMLQATLDDLVTRGAAARAIDSQREAVATSEQQAAEMAYNRGAMLANAGDVAAALPHVERAGRHPTLTAKAADLLERLRARR
jgi:tetratricopeptide (TPR) repeat protein